jgi:cell shape-determining protein MreD
LLFVLAHVVALVAAAALERAWPQPLRLSNVAPDLVLVLVACIGITRGRVAGYAAGLFGAFLLGAIGEGNFAVLLIGLLAVGFLAGHARGRVFADHVVVAPVVAVLATFLACLIRLAVNPPPHFVPWLWEVARLVLYNAVVSPFAYVYARAVARRWPPRAES